MIINCSTSNSVEVDFYSCFFLFGSDLFEKIEFLKFVAKKKTPKGVYQNRAS
jgi:hypothetical protein